MSRRIPLSAQLAAAHNIIAISADEIIALKKENAELKAALTAKELPQYVPAQVPAPAVKPLTGPAPPSHDRQAWKLEYAAFRATHNEPPTANAVREWIAAGRPGL